MTPALIFIAVCLVGYVVAKLFGYRGDAYDFRMSALKILLILVVAFVILIALFGR